MNDVHPFFYARFELSRNKKRVTKRTGMITDPDLIKKMEEIIQEQKNLNEKKRVAAIDLQKQKVR